MKKQQPTSSGSNTGWRADLGLLALRLSAGGLLAGHGAQKLFGSFGGYGHEGTAGWLESLGFKPGRTWAALAGASELGGGALTALGLANPVGPIALQGAMATAVRATHWKKPIWNAEGGAELPLLFSASGVALALTGPGRFSADRLLGVRVPKKVTLLTLAGVAAGVAAARGVVARAERERAEQDARTETPSTGDDLLLESRPGASAPPPPSDLPPAGWDDRFAGDQLSPPPSVP